MQLIDKKYLLCGAAALSVVPMAKATLLVTEPFGYSTGPLTGNVNPTSSLPWSFTGGIAQGTTVVTPGLSNPFSNLQITPSGNADQTSKAKTGADRIGLGTTILDGSQSTNTSNIYYSMLLNVNAITSYTSTAGSFIAGLNNLTGTAAATLTTAGGVLCIAAPTTGSTGSNFVLGVGQNNTPSSGTSNARVFDEADTYTSSDTLFVVVDYQINPGANNDTAKLYVYKDSGSVPVSEPGTALATSDDSVTLGGDTTTSGNGFNSFFLRNNASEPTDITVDEVQVGTTWADVVPTPEPASIGLLGLSLPLMARRRRRAKA
jgi:hypothetical protein